ncbi:MULTISPECIES: hypothetical protein [unclassified Arthrobacter]|uniref:hypothetical protein n=1 Tax=unclassified Arthrobacter TaxID=235627 RepID=UPI00339AE397
MHGQLVRGMELGIFTFGDIRRDPVKLDAQERVTWNGRFRSGLDDALILPRPFPAADGRCELDIWIATGGTLKSSVRAATLRQNAMYACWADPYGTSSGTSPCTGRPPSNTGTTMQR